MTRKQMIQKLDEVASKGFHSAVVIFRSPVTNRFEERHMYADEYIEAELWARSMEKEYMHKHIPFAIWVDNHIEVHWRFEVTEEDCIDE